MLWSNFNTRKVGAEKIYFRKYHFKLEIITCLASYLRYKKCILDREHINNYVARFRNANYNHGGWWGYPRNSYVISDISSSDIDEIIAIGNILRLGCADAKIVIDDQAIRIFSDDEQQLFDIAQAINLSTGRVGSCSTVWRPDPSLTNAIDAGYEILAKDPGFTHKVVLRDKLVGQDIKHQIYNYLLSLGDDVKLSKGVARILRSNGSYLYACWFRTNDPTITTFIELIAPGAVQKIVPVYVKNK